MESVVFLWVSFHVENAFQQTTTKPETIFVENCLKIFSPQQQKKNCWEIFSTTFPQTFFYFHWKLFFPPTKARKKIKMGKNWNFYLYWLKKMDLTFTVLNKCESFKHFDFRPDGNSTGKHDDKREEKKTFVKLKILFILQQVAEA
jgi:hypothetical protein